MKLAHLLAEYLISDKQLHLPGIGSFRLMAGELKENEDRKSASPFNIAFQSDPSVKEDSDLISFIAAKTGKSKTLAASDLDSHLGVMKQFLSIGMPFEMEGIGQLTMPKPGEYEFAAIGSGNKKIKDTASQASGSTPDRKEEFSGYETISPVKRKGPGKLVVILLALAGIGIAIWAGYKLNTKDNPDKIQNKQAIEQKDEETVPVKMNTETEKPLVDTSNSSQKNLEDNTTIQNKPYKFIIEVADKERGVQRYNTLKNYGLPIQMETTDSSVIKLFFSLSALSSDTAKMIDSLRQLYTPYWSKAYVER